MPVPLIKTAISHGRPKQILPVGKSLCSMILLTLLTLPGLSQPIGNWTFTGSTNGAGGTYNSVSNADFSAAIPSRVYHGASEYYGENGWPSGALDPTAYMQFTISPNTGYQLDLTSVVLTIRRSTTGASGSGPTSWSLRSSLDGYATDLGSNSLASSYNNYTITLGSSFLHVYTPVTFRLYGYNAVVTGGGGLNRLVLDNLSIQGIGVVLPVTVTGIQALRNNTNGIDIKWQMGNVLEGTVFQVQRSTNGIDYTTFNSYTENEYKAAISYNFPDARVPAVFSKLYYRIQGKTPDGRSFVSPIVTISNSSVSQALIDYTSVQGQFLHASLQTPEKGLYTISILSMNGAILQQRTFDLQAGVHVVTFPLQSIPHGTYVVRLVGKGVMTGKNFIW